MSEHCGFVVKVNDLRPHTNADRLQILRVFEEDVIVSLDTHIGDIGVYFPCDLQLSEKFCEINNLVRKKDENGNNIGGYMDPDKRNVKAIKLRGEQSNGLYLNITCLSEFCNISDLKVGDQISVINGEEICCKYIPKRNSARGYSGEKIKKAKVNYAPTFFEHVDTEQVAYNLGKFHNGDEIQLTLKMHGTSGRTGHLPLLHTKRTWLDKLLRRHGKDYYEYGYVTGTRRVVLDGKRQGGFYESDDFRYAMAAKFEGKLPKGMVVYYEIVGFQGPNGAPIMGQVANSKIKDKEFSKMYGDVTTFSYGCQQNGQYERAFSCVVNEDGWTTEVKPCCEVYVYRITMVNEDGEQIELSPDQIQIYCLKWNVNYVPEFERFVIPQDVNPGEYVVRKIEQYYDGPDPIGKSHVREGVVARIMNRSKFEVYKMKNISFKILEGIYKEEADAPDIEEAQEIANE